MIYLPSLLTVLASITICWVSLTNARDALKVGDKAPNFSLTDKDGNTHTLDEWRGKKLALYFYPKDSSWGCTKQACSIRDNFADLTDDNIVVVGISKGTQKNKRKFEEQQHLPFPLLNATEKTLKDYGVAGGFFRLYLPKRYTFLINEEGIIVNIIKKIDFKNHAQQIINGFANTHSTH